MTTGVELRTIRMLGLPVPLWAETKQHVDELLREFELMLAGRATDHDGDDTPARLVTLANTLQAQYGGSEERDAELFAALEAGRETVDLEIELPVEAAEGAKALDAMLDEVDAYCRRGEHLLTLASAPEMVAFRQWYLREVVAQLQGAPPTPWAAVRA